MRPAAHRTPNSLHQWTGDLQACAWLETRPTKRHTTGFAGRPVACFSNTASAVPCTTARTHTGANTSSKRLSFVQGGFNPFHALQVGCCAASCCRARQGRAGQGRAGQGRAGQGQAGQGSSVTDMVPAAVGTRGDGLYPGWPQGSASGTAPLLT